MPDETRRNQKRAHTAKVTRDGVCCSTPFDLITGIQFIVQRRLNREARWLMGQVVRWLGNHIQRIHLA